MAHSNDFESDEFREDFDKAFPIADESEHDPKCMRCLVARWLGIIGGLAMAYAGGYLIGMIVERVFDRLVPPQVTS